MMHKQHRNLIHFFIISFFGTMLWGGCSEQEEDNARILECENGMTAPIENGADGQDGDDEQGGTPCTVVDNGNGSITISCDDGTGATVFDVHGR